jgi:hypothetical protein
MSCPGPGLAVMHAGTNNNGTVRYCILSEYMHRNANIYDQRESEQANKPSVGDWGVSDDRLGDIDDA